MVVIANDCVGGELYRLCDEEFKSPFMWTVLPIKDFIELYKNYDNINFKNITLFFLEIIIRKMIFS